MLFNGLLAHFQDFGRGGGPNHNIADLSPKPGETISLPTARMRGRTVVGRFRLPPEIADAAVSPNAPPYTCVGTECRASSDRPWTPYPPEIAKASEEVQSEWWTRWSKSPEGKAYYANYSNHMVWVEPDRRFRIDGVGQDKYRMSIKLRSAGESADDSGELLATVKAKFEVPPMPNGYSDEPLDLGEIPATLAKGPRRGQAVPDFAAPQLDGALWKLSSARGKVVLIDFWATWCGPCIAAMPELDRLHQELGNRGVTIVSIIADEEAKTAKAFIESKKYGWRQLHVGPQSPLLESLGIDAYPTLLVIGADGKLRYRGHQSQSAASAVRIALDEGR